MLAALAIALLLGASPSSPAASPAATPAATPDASDLWRAAEAADHHDHDYARAIELYGKLVTDFPGARLSRMAQSRHDYLVQATAKGIEPLRRFESVKEGWSTGDHAAGEAQVLSILADFPDFPLRDEVLLWLGDRAAERRDWKAARARYQQILDEMPKSALAGFALAGVGHAAFESGDYDASAAAFEKIAETNIPGAKGVARGERDRVLKHVARRRRLRVAIAVLALALAAAMGTVDRSRLRGAASRAVGREVLYVAPLLGVLALVAPSDARVPLLAIGSAGLAVLVAALVWAEAARPGATRPLARAAAALVATASGAAAIYAVMYALDVLVAVEKAVGA